MEELPEGQEQELSREQLEDLNISRNRDFMLQDMVVSAESGISFPVTLYTAAGLVSGFVISANQYLDEIEKQLTGPRSNEESARIAKGWIEDYREIYSVPRGVDDPRPVLIHLKDAQLFTGDSVIPSEQRLPWRGKIESVIGFHFGTLQN